MSLGNGNYLDLLIDYYVLYIFVEFEKQNKYYVL